MGAQNISKPVVKCQVSSSAQLAHHLSCPSCVDSHIWATLKTTKLRLKLPCLSSVILVLSSFQSMG